jgi:hypothetical protein
MRTGFWSKNLNVRLRLRREYNMEVDLHKQTADFDWINLA